MSEVGPSTSRRLGQGLSAALIAMVGLPSPVAETEPELRAHYRGNAIPLTEVRLHHCHDADRPVIRCFDTELARDVSLAVELTIDLGVLSPSSVFYVTFYEHAGYGGLSYTTSQPIPNLVGLGWNDAISSFKSLNGQRPKWWRDASYLGTSWQWAAGAWVSYVGDDANDRFSSLKNVP